MTKNEVIFDLDAIRREFEKQAEEFAHLPTFALIAARKAEALRIAMHAVNTLPETPDARA